VSHGAPRDAISSDASRLHLRPTRTKPGVCIPWEEKAKELPPISGDPDLFRRIWEDIDVLGNMYIWQCLLSF